MYGGLCLEKSKLPIEGKLELSVSSLGKFNVFVFSPVSSSIVGEWEWSVRAHVLVRHALTDETVQSV